MFLTNIFRSVQSLNFRRRKLQFLKFKTLVLFLKDQNNSDDHLSLEANLVENENLMNN